MADEPTTTDTEGDPPTPEPPTAPPAPKTTPAKNDDDKGELPPELKTVVDKERRLARDADKKAKALEAELAQLKATQMSEHEKAVDAARKEGLTEGVSKGNSRLLRAEVLAAAAGKVADPEDAYAILANTGALTEFAVGDNGEVDSAGIKAAIDDLVKTKPHLSGSRDPEFGARPPSTPAGDSDAGMDAWLRTAGRRR